MRRHERVRRNGHLAPRKGVQPAEHEVPQVPVHVARVRRLDKYARACLCSQDGLYCVYLGRHFVFGRLAFLQGGTQRSCPVISLTNSHAYSAAHSRRVHFLPARTTLPLRSRLLHITDTRKHSSSEASPKQVRSIEMRDVLKQNADMWLKLTTFGEALVTFLIYTRIPHTSSSSSSPLPNPQSTSNNTALTP